MNKNRPVNLNLMTVRFPVTAISSICHRVSGVVIFLGVPFALYALGKALESRSSYDELLVCLSSPLGLAAVWLMMVAMTYHVLAGVRHLLMDIGIGEKLRSGRFGAYLVLIAGVVLAVLEGAWLIW